MIYQKYPSTGKKNNDNNDNNDNSNNAAAACQPVVPFDPRHTHEFEESTKLAEMGADRHNHRVAGVTSEAIPTGATTHVHAYGILNTDFIDHHHEIGGLTGENIPIPNTNKHIHLIRGTTTSMDGHTHDYLFTTQIDSPLV